MTEPTLYQIDRGLDYDDELAEMIRVGVLVPVERCEHGNIYRHPIAGSGFLVPSDGQNTTLDVEWCPGAGIGDNETQHEEWCNVFKSAGGCSCAGVEGTS